MSAVMQASRLTLRARVVLLCAVVGGLLAALAAGAAVVANANRDHIDTILSEIGPLRTDAESLLTTLVDQETGVRGYAVSGDPADLAPYRAGVEQERQLIGHMVALIDPDDPLRPQIDEVAIAAQRWRDTVAEPVIAAVAAEGTAAAQALLTDAARQQFDGLRADVDQLQADILVVRNQVAGDARSTSGTLVVLLIVAALVVVAAGIVLMVSLNRLVIGPVTGLAAQVRQVANGEYERDIAGVGPPELAALASDVDGMRRKIAADLDEVRDARERVEWVNSQLQKQAEELVRSNRDLEQFAYVASHDLQEPLRKVASFCQLLQRRYAGQLDARADQYIGFAVDGAQRMQRLINDLLAFSRIGRLTSGFTDVDLNKVMTDVASQTESTREYVGGELTWSDLPVVSGEEPLLTNLLVNLVSNSFKFRQPEIAPKVEVSARQIDGEWEITCRDNGIGIEAEFADKIFVIFQRLHSKDAYPGTGIGLAIGKKIVEYHGGRIWVDTQVEQGTAISFTLPVTPRQAEAAENDGAPAAATQAAV
ncbi:MULTISPECIES: sensor histidine kinase [unclassified Solwaraspora]|uniref:sensor histidine kinase n=1 Tax=unclassified Solwaraspora TaxID=2627926 RepID=UPI00259BC835|nr:sensor histidine kinase [Solwaraspora sp. WMMA2056]WJK42183.1 CHASE3 domain-containing protein [Solwaraspora sp. WMMA2056]